MRRVVTATLAVVFAGVAASEAVARPTDVTVVNAVSISPSGNTVQTLERKVSVLATINGSATCTGALSIPSGRYSVDSLVYQSTGSQDFPLLASLYLTLKTATGSFVWEEIMPSEKGALVSSAAGGRENGYRGRAALDFVYDNSGSAMAGDATSMQFCLQQYGSTTRYSNVHLLLTRLGSA